MFGIVVAALAVVTIAIKWVTIGRLRDLNADLLEVQTSAMNARNRLKASLNEKAGTERKISMIGHNCQVTERHISLLEQEFVEMQAHVEEQAQIVRQKLALAEDLKRKSGPIRP